MKNLKLYDFFLWTGFKCLKAEESLQGDSLFFFTTQCPWVPGTHLINFDGMKGWTNLDLESTQHIWIHNPGLEIQYLNH